jgi:hypothetical protein
MPYIISGAIAAAAGLFGFFTGGGFNGVGNIVKYGVLGIGAYYVAKAFKVI